VLALLGGVREHSVWAAPRAGLASVGIAYALDDGSFEWVVLSLEQPWALLEAPASLNATKPLSFSRGAGESPQLLLLLKLAPRTVGQRGAAADFLPSGAVAFPSEPRPFEAYDAPRLAAASPSHGPATGGTLVALVGEGFLLHLVAPTTAPACRFGTSTAPATIVTPTTARCASAAGVGGDSPSAALSQRPRLPHGERQLA